MGDRVAARGAGWKSRAPGVVISRGRADRL